MMTMMPMIMRRIKHRMSLSVAMRRINARIYKRQGGGGGGSEEAKREVREGDALFCQRAVDPIQLSRHSCGC